MFRFGDQMAFQFQCPDCQRLEVDDSRIGKPVICPYCGKKLIVPERPSTRVDSARSSGSRSKALSKSAVSVGKDQPLINTESSLRPVRKSLRRNEIAPESEFGPALEVYHISCPRGFVMEVPGEMLGTTALCPCCHHKMRLRLKETHEFKRRRAIEEEAEEVRLGRFWLHVAIIVTALVIASFGLMGIVLMLL